MIWMIAVHRVDPRQFGIRHLLVVLALVSICLWMGNLDETMFLMFTILTITGAVGAVAAKALFLVSDSIDRRGINERNLFSRFLNFLGLLSFVATWVLVALMMMAILFYGGLLFLDAVAPQQNTTLFPLSPMWPR